VLAIAAHDRLPGHPELLHYAPRANVRHVSGRLHADEIEGLECPGEDCPGSLERDPLAPVTPVDAVPERCSPVFGIHADVHIADAPALEFDGEGRV
jgi:hypothetical protein